MTKNQIIGMLRFHKSAYNAYKRTNQPQQAKQARAKMIEMYLILRSIR